MMEAALHNIKDYVATADENGRQEVLEALRNLTLTLETPHDALQRFSALVSSLVISASEYIDSPVIQHLQTAVVRAAIDMRLFNILAASKVPMSVDKIAQEARSASLLTGVQSTRNVWFNESHTQYSTTSTIPCFIWNGE